MGRAHKMNGLGASGEERMWAIAHAVSLLRHIRRFKEGRQMLHSPFRNRTNVTSD